METNEETFASTAFGTVTSKRIIYRAERSWFSGGSREDIPLNHVTSVRLATSRSVLAGLVILLLGLSLLMNPALMIVGMLLTVWAVLLLWGSPSVWVNTSGRDERGAKGLPWQRGEANAFVEAVRSQLFRDDRK